MDISKGRSPFYPGQPVPVELFVGRATQINELLTHGVQQVSLGKPIAMWIQGEYGIGKSSIAGLVQRNAEKDYGLHGIYVTLGGAATLEEMAVAILEASIKSGSFDLKRSEKIQNWLAKYIGQQTLFGININLEALKKDAPALIASPYSMLDFLSETINRLKDVGVKGVFLILDEINGITTESRFSHFIKGLIDTNALSRNPVPFLLMVCGVSERRREMIQKHQPVERIFDIVEIEILKKEEMEDFFHRAFQQVQITIKKEALELLCHYSAGFPKIMHIVGDMAFWTDNDGIIDEQDALFAVVKAASEVGNKYVGQQVYKTLRSEDYHSILKKIAQIGPREMSFTKALVEKGLTDSEKKKFNNFLQKMKKLNVIRTGDIRGEYIFNLRMVRLYIWLQSQAENKNID